MARKKEGEGRKNAAEMIVFPCEVCRMPKAMNKSLYHRLVAEGLKPATCGIKCSAVKRSKAWTERRAA